MVLLPKAIVIQLHTVIFSDIDSGQYMAPNSSVEIQLIVPDRLLKPKKWN